uniref:ATP-dependent zinc metalloprotease FtsH n=1 Tax=Lygus hesperus TaxID=30085 RepID=A0A146KPB3_LYGHE
MIVMLGGRAAEEVLLSTASSGATDDLQRTTDMALKQVLAFGMSNEVGLLAYNPEYTQAGRDFTNFSNDAQFRAEVVAQRLVMAAHDMAKQIVSTNQDKVNVLVDLLLQTKEVEKTELEQL